MTRTCLDTRGRPEEFSWQEPSRITRLCEYAQTGSAASAAPAPCMTGPAQQRLIHPPPSVLFLARMLPARVFARSKRRTLNSHRGALDGDRRRSRSSLSRRTRDRTVVRMSARGIQVFFGTYFCSARQSVALSVIAHQPLPRSPAALSPPPAIDGRGPVRQRGPPRRIAAGHVMPSRFRYGTSRTRSDHGRARRPATSH